VLEAELSGLERLLASAEDVVSIVRKVVVGSGKGLLAGAGRMTTAPVAISIDGWRSKGVRSIGRHRG